MVGATQSCGSDGTGLAGCDGPVGQTKGRSDGVREKKVRWGKGKERLARRRNK